MITIRTTDFSSGIMMLTTADGAIIYNPFIISEFVNRLGRMEKRVAELKKDLEKETEKLKITRKIYDKELEKAERALENKYTEIERMREGCVSEKVM